MVTDSVSWKTQNIIGYKTNILILWVCATIVWSPLFQHNNPFPETGKNGQSFYLFMRAKISKTIFRFYSFRWSRYWFCYKYSNQIKLIMNDLWYYKILFSIPGLFECAVVVCTLCSPNLGSPNMVFYFFCIFYQNFDCFLL